MLSPDLVSALSTDIFFDYIAVRLDAAKAAGLSWRIDWHFTDTGERLALNLENSTLTCRLGKLTSPPEAIVTTTRPILEAIAFKRLSFAEALASGKLSVEGHSSKPQALFDMLEDFEMMFEVMTPGPGR